ncbi:hypothetical protein F4861DRAFT_522630 [Xylaria intraflava]|nr:hypothetical protein F4861DRAFT_522630 [Xylaria intraflava]
MTERRLIESATGLAGRLSHIPYGTDKPENCGWHSSRDFARNAPVFRALGHYKTWIAVEPDHAAHSEPPPKLPFTARRKQRRWLVKNHPEASLDHQVLQDLLIEDANLPPQPERSWQSCFFSLGQLTEISSRRATGVPLLVTVTGGAHNVLRLARLDEEKWTWYRMPNVRVCLSEVAGDKPTLWIEDDVGPINRVKCLVDPKPYSPTRWLAVQRDSGTTIFQPEYRKIPLDGSFGDDASRIAANPLFHISKEQTGGTVHTDVAFNPGTRSKSPQLAIIDERGFWSIWDLGFSRFRHAKKPASTPGLCGHINHGILEQLPYRDQSDTRWHKVLWVGSSESDSGVLNSVDLDIHEEDMSSQSAFPPIPRSSSLLVYSSVQVRLFDLITSVYLPDLLFRRQDSLDYILDVQTTHDPQYLCVLTTSKLYIVRIYSKPGEEWDKPEKVWSILFSTPHFRSSFDLSLKLSLTPGIGSERAPSWFLFLYASTNPWTEAFSFEVSPTDPNTVRCQPNVPGLGGLQETTLNSTIRTLSVNPAPIIVNASKSLTKAGHGLAEKRIRLYQIVALRSDLSVVSSLCAFSWLPSIPIGVPNERVDRQDRVARWRGGDSRRLRSSHVISEDDLVISDEEPPSARVKRNLKIFYEHLDGIFSGRDRRRSVHSLNGDSFEHILVDAVHQNIDESLTINEPLPTRTLFQIMPSFQEAPGISFSAGEWENEIGRLNNIHPNVSLYSFDLLRSRLDLPLSASSQEAYSRLLEIANASLHHRASDHANKQRGATASEQIAYDLYLSLYGIGCRDLGERQSRGATGEATGEDTPLDSQTETLPSSPRRLESSVSTTTPSQRSTSEVAEGEDPAMTLIKAYTGTGIFVPEKRFELLDKWQLGADPSDYVFDLDRSDDAEANKLRREKQLAREDRKRRRAASLLHLSQEPELPASQPTPSTSFANSQPSKGLGSQRQAIHSDIQVMSQPSAGVFGKRPPNKKVKKRKGGF